MRTLCHRHRDKLVADKVEEGDANLAPGKCDQEKEIQGD